MPLYRPSPRECINKVHGALKAISLKRCFIPLPESLPETYECLGIDSESELWEIIKQLLCELASCDPYKCYCGKHPPERSYKDQLRDMELWPYCCYSNVVNREIYIKFCLKDGCFYFVSCHESAY